MRGVFVVLHPLFSVSRVAYEFSETPCESEVKAAMRVFNLKATASAADPLFGWPCVLHAKWSCEDRWVKEKLLGGEAGRPQLGMRTAWFATATVAC